MSCACEISMDDYNAPDAFTQCDRVARKEHRCGECLRAINPGETYRYESGIWEGEPNDHKTCADCLSLRDAFFCGWGYGEVWNDFTEMVGERDGEGIADTRLAKLTPTARASACKIIEEAWFDEAYEAMTERQEAILRNALGLLRSEKPYRNSYSAPFGSENYADCCALVDLGFMQRSTILVSDEGGFFHVTLDGKKAVGLEANEVQP